MPGKQDFIFLSNYLCLDFVNTQVLENGQVKDLIPDFEEFMQWLVAAHAIERKKAEAYFNAFNGESDAEEIIKQAHQFRDTIRRFAEICSEGAPISEGVQTSSENSVRDVIEFINSIYRTCHGFLQLDSAGNEFKETFVSDNTGLAQLLLPIAKSTSKLLQNRKRAYIRRCTNPHCILYFYDTSKNHTRRWCSMETCGNRVKASTHYRRHRKNLE